MIDYPFPDVFISKLDTFPENIFQTEKKKKKKGEKKAMHNLNAKYWVTA